MPYITAAVLIGFLSYVFAWYKNIIGGNFSLLLFVATTITGAYWLLEKFIFLPQRKAAAQSLTQNLLNSPDTEESVQAKQKILAQPWWLDWTAGIFPVIAAVFILRSFIVEPFKIPSGSMIPTLTVGDLILVNKFTYGLRMPVLNFKLTSGNKPQRGDVMVFRYPPNTDLDYIKRIVGVPGDVVQYNNKQLTINGKLVPKVALADYVEHEEADNVSADGSINRVKVSHTAQQFEETFPTDATGKTKLVKTLNYSERPAGVYTNDEFQYKQNCQYSTEGVTCTVPEGHYFMMGDNRDNSLDSRYWGFVPEKNIVGKAFFVWMNFGNFNRIGSFN